MKRTLLLMTAAWLCGMMQGWAQTAYAVFDGESTLTFKYDNNMPAENAWDVSDTGNYYPGWSSLYTTTTVNKSVTRVVFEPSFAEARPVSCSYWFERMSNLVSIDGLTYLNTSDVIYMNQMFADCESLVSLDLSNFNTHNVQTMSEMFKDCKKLVTLDLSSFNTDNLKRIKAMFSGCSSLESVNVSSFNTESVTDMNNLFWGCSSLKTLDLSNFNTANVEKMKYMFSGCSSLKYILIGEQWNTDKVSSSDNMFSSCYSLVGEYGNWIGQVSLNGSFLYVDKTYAHAGEDGYMRSTLPQTTKKAYAQYDGAGTLTLKYDENMPEQNAWEAGSTNGKCPWSDINQLVTKVVIEPSFANARPNGCVAWFNMSKLTSVEGVQYLNTSRVRSMNSMFFACNLTEFDFSRFDTRKVKNMKAMFGNSKFTTLDLSSFYTSEVVEMEEMFSFCRNLTSINLSSFNTGKVINMFQMFQYCDNLKRLNLGSFNTAQVTNMGGLFSFCKSLQYILIGPDWNVDAVTDSSALFSKCNNLIGQDGTKVGDVIDKTFAHAGEGGYMREVGMKVYAFYDGNGTLSFCYDKNMPSENAWEVEDAGESCPWPSLVSSITKVVIDPTFARARPRVCNYWFWNMKELASIEGLRNLNTSEVNQMFGLFSNCNSLTELDLSSFDTRNVTSMEAMFYRCSSLTELDLSSFDTWNVTKTGLMFAYCTNLESIYISEKWELWKVTTSSNMFDGCTSLVGEYGATVGSKTDKTYAHAKQNGYLKMKSTDGVDTVRMNSQNDNSPAVWYDLQGRRLTAKPSTPGLYIHNGRKYLNK